MEFNKLLFSPIKVTNYFDYQNTIIRFPKGVCEITGHSLTTMYNYYQRVSEESKRGTLQKSNLRNILKSKY